MVVEKILGVREALREDWPVYGTSGYDFLNVLNGLFVDAENRTALTRFYRDWTQDPRPFAEVVYDAKRLIMQVSLSSEVHMLAYQLDRLAQQHRRSRDFTFNSLRHALQEVIACFPVYRSYITTDDAAPGRPPLLCSRRWPGRSAKTPPSAASCLSSCETCCCSSTRPRPARTSRPSSGALWASSSR